VAQQPVLWVEIVPTTKGIARKVEKEFSGGFDATEKRGKGLFGKIAGFAGKAGTVVAGAAAALTGLAVKGGFERMLKIEDAEAKLTGLGHSTEAVTKIMGSALAAVKGTAFGLDTAATIAASAVAAGIEPGKQLENYLRLTADAATIAGISMEEMGSIMNKVNANGKAMTENLNQLSDRGIPILGWLAKEYGVTTAEMSKMVSQGKVDAQTFNRVLQENIGGAALASGNTTRGAFANMLAALSRVGVALLDDVFPYFKDTFNGITGLLDDLTDRIGPFRESMQDMFGPLADGALTAVVGAFETLVGAFQAGGDAITKTGVDGFLQGIGQAARILWDAISPLLPQILELWTAFSPLGLVLSELGPVLGTLASTLAGVLAGAITAIMPFVIELATLFGGLLAEALPVLIPLISTLAGFIGDLAAALLPLVGTLISALMPVFNALAPVVMSIIAALLPFISTLIDALMPIVTLVAELFATVLAPILDALVPIINAVLSVVMALIEPLLALLGPILGPLADLFVLLINAALTPVLAALQFLIPVIVGIVEALANFLIPIIDTVMDVLGGLIDFIVGVFSLNWEKAWNGIVKAFTGIFQGINNIAKSVINLVIDAINGIIGGINALASTVKDVTGGAIDIRIPKIPRLANGALIEATPGGSAAIIGEGRYDEAVLPLGGPQLAKIQAALQGPAATAASDEGWPEVLAMLMELIEQMPEKFARKLAGYSRIETRQGVA
jgi:tape measure domain-containing protein